MWLPGPCSLETQIERPPTSDGGGLGVNFPTPNRPENNMHLSPPDGQTFVLGRCAEEGEHASMHASLLALCGQGICTLLVLLLSFLSGGGSIFGSLCMPGDYIDKYGSGFLELFYKYCTLPRDILRGL